VPDDIDDLLDPEEIEALLKEAGGDDADGLAEGEDAKVETSTGSEASATESKNSQSAQNTATSTGNESDVLNGDDIEALLQQHNSIQSEQPEEQGTASTASQPTSAHSQPSPDEILQKAERDLQAAINPEPPREQILTGEKVSATAFEFAEFLSQNLTDDNLRELSSLQDVELDLRIELGRAELLIEEVMRLKEGSVVPLDKLAGDPVDILVNGRLMARGEVLVLNDNFCIRVAEILTPDF